MDGSKEVYLNVPYCPINYKLSLDDLDLALLPMSWLMESRGLLRPPRVGPPDTQTDRELDENTDEKCKEKPVVRLEGSDCATVEFEATAEREERYCTGDTECDEDKKDCQTRFCHICKINVPNKYTKEHNRSKLHVTLLRLANEAVNRLNKHIQQQLSEDPDSCYCTPCNEEVDSLDEHERQIQHRLLKKREDFLANLLDLYIEEHGAFSERTRQILNNLESQASLDDISNLRTPGTLLQKEKSNVVQPSNSIVTAVARTENPCKVSPKYPVEPTSLKDGAVENGSAVIPNNKKEPPAKSETTLLASCGITQSPQHEKPIVGINKIVPAPQDNDTDYYFCKTCAINVPNNASNWHNNCPAHKEKLKQSSGSPVTKTLSKDADATSAPNSAGGYICIICAVKIPNTTAHITAHNNSAAHRAKLEPQEKNSLPKQTASTAHYLCNVCGVIIPNCPANITEHDQGTAHKAKLAELRSGNNCTGSSNTTNDTKVTSSLAPHKPKHQWLAGSSLVPHLTQAAKEAIKTGQHFCSICAVKVPNNPNNISGHNNGAAHRAKLAQLQTAGEFKNTHKDPVSSTATKPKPADNVVPKQLADYFCDICSVNVPLTNVITHVNGLSHNAKLQERLNTTSESTKNVVLVPKNSYATKGLPRVNYYCTVCGVNTGVGNFEQHLMSRSHKDHVRNGNLTDEIVGYNLCQLCNTEMPNRHKDVNDHYTGTSHRSNFETRLSRNQIERLSGEQIHCKACLKSMHLSFLWGHIKNEEHVANLKIFKVVQSNPIQQSDPDFCYVCRVTVGRNNMKVHIIGRLHKSNSEAQKVA